MTLLIRIILTMTNQNNNNNKTERCNSRFLPSPRSPASKIKWSGRNHVQITCNTKSHATPNHVQHIERVSRATCRDTSHVVRRDSSAIKFDRVEIAFI